MKWWRVEGADANTLRRALAEAGAVLRDGGLVAFPTETVYGLGANAWSEAAARRVFAAKGRPADNPLIVHIADRAELAGVIDHPQALSDAVRRAMDVFWPGPLTLILPAGGRIAPAVRPGMETVGVRMPAHPVAQALIRAAGCPVAAPSANRSGRPSPTSAEDVAEDLSGRIDGLVDGGPCGIGVESTVAWIGEDGVVVYRPGGVTPEQLAKVTGLPVRLAPGVAGAEGVDAIGASGADASGESGEAGANAGRERDARAGTGGIQGRPGAHAGDGEEVSGPIRSPGMKYRHYAPRAPVHVWWGDAGRVREAMADFAVAARAGAHRTMAGAEDAKSASAKGQPAGAAQTERGSAPGSEVAGEMRIALIARPQTVPRGWDPAWVWVPAAPESVLDDGDYAQALSRHLYRLLRAFDRQGADVILVEGVRPEGLGLAVMNRLAKAAEGRVRRV